MNQPIIHKILAALGYDKKELHNTATYKEEYIRVESVLKDLKRVAKDRVLYKILDCSNKKEETFLKEKILLGKSIHDFLGTPKKVILLATTLGTQVDQLIRKELILSIANGVLMDTAAMEVIESHLNEWVEDLEDNEALKGYYLSPRYSPGYGDMPISVQKHILQALETQKQIGLTVSPSGILLPKKSVTALIGVYETPFENTYLGCDSCLIRNTCKKRERGNYCGY